MNGITGEHYAIDDKVLPILALHPAVDLRIDLEEIGVEFIIGPREYEWPRGYPDVCLVGTGSTDSSMGRREKICNLSRRGTWIDCVWATPPEAARPRITPFVQRSVASPKRC
jgi:hypothetical protein